MAKKTIKEKRASGMKCSPSPETIAKLRLSGKANYRKSPLFEINGIATELQREAGYKIVTIPAKTVKKPNLSRKEAIKRATKLAKRKK